MKTWTREHDLHKKNGKDRLSRDKEELLNIYSAFRNHVGERRVRRGNNWLMWEENN